MELSLDQLTLQWKENAAYTDVEASYLNHPSDQQMQEKCPHGCLLKIAGVKDGTGPWRAMYESADHYRQTRTCIAHGYARIYVTTGLDAEHANYKIVT